MEKRLNSTLEKIDVEEKILEIISNKVRQKDKEIYKMNSGENYYKARNRIKLIVEEFLGHRKKVIFLAVSSVVKAVKENHQREIPLKDLPNSVYEICFRLFRCRNLSRKITRFGRKSVGFYFR